MSLCHSSYLQMYFTLIRSDLSKRTEGQFWQEIIEPTSYLDHISLRDELQMNVLSYDDDAMQQDIGK